MMHKLTYYTVLCVLLSPAAYSDTAHHATPSHSPVQTGTESILSQQQAATVYACPMHPHIKQHQPGNCPICGMALVIQQQIPGSSVQVSGTMQQALAIRTASAEKRTLWRFINSWGQVQYPEDAIHHSHIRAEGWLTQLYARTLGQPVKAGDKLFSYYSPELLVAQDDYLQAWSVARQNPAQHNQLLQRAETRLRLLGLTQRDIQHLQQQQQSQQQITVYAHQDGIITELNVRDGMYISPGDTLLEITSLNTVWLLADIPEPQFDWVTTGMAAEVDIPGHHRYKIESVIDYLYPALDPQSLSLKARITLDNSEGLLKPNMLLPVRLYGGPLRNVLAVPREAILVSAPGSRVVVKQGDEFTIRPVTLGTQAQGWVQILSGLHEHEEVVVSGQFLLDAEASLQQLPVSHDIHQHQH